MAKKVEKLVKLQIPAGKATNMDPEVNKTKRTLMGWIFN